MHACFYIVVLFFLCTNPTPFGYYENKAIIIIIIIIVIIINEQIVVMSWQNSIVSISENMQI